MEEQESVEQRLGRKSNEKKQKNITSHKNLSKEESQGTKYTLRLKVCKWTGVRISVL